MAKDSSDSRSAGAGLLFFLGFALVAAGVGFATAPLYSWQVMKVAQKAGAYGVENGELVVGGLVLFGLGFVARAAGGARPASSSGSSSWSEDFQLLNEQVSAKIAQVRTSLSQVTESVNNLAAQQQAALQQKQSDSSSGSDHGQEALFRLAASLDKFNAHFDERIHSIDLQLRSGFEMLAGEVRRGGTRPEVALAPSHAVHAGHGHAAHGHSPAPHAPEGAIDFYETMQKLDAIAGSGSDGDQPPAPFPSSNADVFEVQDDFRKPY